MKKINLSLLIFLAFFFEIYGQTREVDYTYINEHYMSQVNDPNYRKRELTQSDFQKNGDVKAYLQFTQFSTINDGKSRGIAVVYKEKRNNNELVKLIIICIPEKNSDSSINLKLLTTLNAIDDMFVLKYILMGFIKLGINTN